MSITEISAHQRGPAALLGEAMALVGEAAGAMSAAQSDDDLVATVELCAQLRAAIAAVEAGAVAEADHRDLAKTRLAYGSTGDWLTHLGGLRKGEGKRVVARAHALIGPLEATREAMAAGQVSPEQADVIVKSVEQLPVGEAVRARGEATLLDHARSFDATDLARTGRHLVHVVDPDAEDRRLERALAREERGAHLSRFLSIVSDGAGGVRVKGRGSAEDGALLTAALLPLAAPDQAVDDERSDLLHDPRDAGARMWDALVQTAQHALDTVLPPQSHGAPARLLVTTSFEALHDGVGATGDGAELSAPTLRRLACDAEVIPAVLGAHGEPLDVGRTRRVVTPAIWAALVVRDQHCAFPGCDRPPLMCHAHHIIHWISGGETKLDNLVLLCGHHHRTIHHSPWEVRINDDDRKPEFRPPMKFGVPRTWLRHRRRRE